MPVVPFAESHAVPPRRSLWVWALLTVMAQVLFILSWLVAAFWQGPRYSVLAHSISDMYAVTAPSGLLLVVVLTVCGAVTMIFALFVVWKSLGPGGWTAAVGSLLLALSIFSLGDLLTPFERLACRMADPGCSSAAQTANAGGQLDTTLSTAGVMLFLAAGFFLAEAMRKTPGWGGWPWPTRWVMILVAVTFLGDGVLGGVGLGGLFERLLAAVGAAAIAALAVGVMRRNRSARTGG
ncbi:MAG: DUF998 domain-containing protein [Microbacteriaceae bacterium]